MTRFAGGLSSSFALSTAFGLTAFAGTAFAKRFAATTGFALIGISRVVPVLVFTCDDGLALVQGRF